MRKTVIIALTITLLFTLCSCGMRERATAVTDEDGNMLAYELSEIPDDGFYVLNKKKKTFTPVMGVYSGTGDSVLSSGYTQDPARYIWFGTKTADLMSVIPNVDGKTTFLVMLQKDESGMPDEYYVEKYGYEGNTLGVSFTFGETGDTLYIDSQDICDSSMAKDVLKDTSSQLLKVHKINGSEDLPKKNVDIDISKLMGLEKDKKYQLGYFDGTEYKDVELIADASVFKSKGAVFLNEPLEYTEYGFFYITLPENLSQGYYDINGAGLFRYYPPEK